MFAFIVTHARKKEKRTKGKTSPVGEENCAIINLNEPQMDNSLPEYFILNRESF